MRAAPAASSTPAATSRASDEEVAAADTGDSDRTASRDGEPTRLLAGASNHARLMTIRLDRWSLGDKTLDTVASPDVASAESRPDRAPRERYVTE